LPTARVPDSAGASPARPGKGIQTPILQVRRQVSARRRRLTPSFLAGLFWWVLGCIICQQVVSFLSGNFHTLFSSHRISSSLSNNSPALDLGFSWVLPHCASVTPELGREQSRFHQGVISALLTGASAFVVTSFSIASSLQPL